MMKTVLSNKKISSGRSVLMLLVLFTLSLPVFSQADKKFIRKGNREYNKDKFSESEVSYRKAVDNNRRSPDAVFNIGDALYKQQKYEEAAKHFNENISMNDDAERKAAGMYNLGNSLLQANKVKESIDAYKNSLKLKPDNIAAKYNLAYAQDLLKKQEEQKQQEQQEQNKENDDKKNDQNKQNDDKNQDQKDNKEQQQQQQQQQKKQDQSISKEDAQRLLNALANDEKNVQEKVKLAKAARERKQTVKNW
ncbi:MAG TPA: tetratricopeptide repeat protein [Bacteroidales bacterium]|nr:tetratricopeptide repeat protein [Bacteroidales bacterium]